MTEPFGYLFIDCFHYASGGLACTAEDMETELEHLVENDDEYHQVRKNVNGTDVIIMALSPGPVPDL